MNIEILGEKVIRDNKIIILKIKNNVFKIPFSVSSAKEMMTEKERIKQAKNDSFFSQYLPVYKFFSIIQIIPYMDSSHEDYNFYIKKYFEKSFSESLNWERVKLSGLIDNYFLEFIEKYVLKEYSFFHDYLEKNSLPLSSSHGDFHEGNILFYGNKLYFIDWSRYNKHSSRYFDLYDYYIFSKKNKGTSWIKIWEEEFNLEKKKILGVSVNRNYLLTYGIWKVSEDLRVLKLGNKLNKFKIKKYLNFIKIFKKLNLDFK